MLVAGDEFGRTQQGNNNAYCQDNEISWLDWQAAASEAGQTQIDYVARLADLRRRYPVLRAATFLYGQDSPGHGINDVEWWDERGERLSPEDWQNPEARALMMRRASRNEAGDVEAVSLLINGSADPVTFHLPPPHAGRTVLIDSARPEQGELAIEDSYEVAPQGAVLVTWTLTFEEDAA
jgi:glycogen operon protein